MGNPSKLEMIKIHRISEFATRWIGSSASLITHTVGFALVFIISFLGFLPLNEMLLILTTVVSLEAIYLSIFIQMSVNKSNQYIEIIQEDVEEISEGVEEINDGVDELNENIEDIQDEENSKALSEIEETLLLLIKEVSSLKRNIKPKK